MKAKSIKGKTPGEMLAALDESKISIYKGERGYLPGKFHVKSDCDIIMTIVTRLEVHRIKQAILEIDSDAFFYNQSIKEVKGGIVKSVGGHA